MSVDVSDDAALEAAIVEAERAALALEVPEPIEIPAPVYQDERVTLYHGDSTRIGLSLAAQGVRGLVLFDPPYSERVHRNSMSNGRVWRDGTNRKVELGFEHLTPQLRRGLGRAAAALSSGWSLVFCDSEGFGRWAHVGEAVGFQHMVNGWWRKLGGSPRMNGHCGAVPCEVIIVFRNRKGLRWNSGGRAAAYECGVDEVLTYDVPIAQRRGNGDSDDARHGHTTEKPVRLMRDLIADHCNLEDPDEPVIDLTAGLCTTLVAAARLGRRAIGIEQDERWIGPSIERLRREAEKWGSETIVGRAKQLGMMDLAKRGGDK